MDTNKPEPKKYAPLVCVKCGVQFGQSATLTGDVVPVKMNPPYWHKCFAPQKKKETPNGL